LGAWSPSSEDAQHVRLLDPTTGPLLREHRRQARGRHAIQPADQPPRTPALPARAARAGAHVGTLCEAVHRRDGERGVCRILGVLALAKQYGAAVVEDACGAALDLGAADSRFVRRYLERTPGRASSASRGSPARARPPAFLV